MFVRLSKLRKVVAEQATRLFEELQDEDRDRLRRGAPGEYPGESHTGFEEAFEFEDVELEAKKDEGDDEEGEKKEKPAFLKGKGKSEPKKDKKSPPKEKQPEDDSSDDEEEESQPAKKEPSPKHKKAKKGLEKAQKSKLMPKSQVDPRTGVKQDVDLDQLAQLATEMGYRLEKNDPEPEEVDDVPDLDLDSEPGDELSMSGDGDEMDFGDLGDLGDGDEEDLGQDIEDEDVAIMSSDEDIDDVLGLGQDEDELGLEGNPLSMKKASPVAQQGAKKQGGLKLHIRK